MPGSGTRCAESRPEWHFAESPCASFCFWGRRDPTVLSLVQQHEIVRCPNRILFNKYLHREHQHERASHRNGRKARGECITSKPLFRRNASQVGRPPLRDHGPSHFRHWQLHRQGGPQEHASAHFRLLSRVFRWNHPDCHLREPRFLLFPLVAFETVPRSQERLRPPLLGWILHVRQPGRLPRGIVLCSRPCCFHLASLILFRCFPVDDATHHDHRPHAPPAHGKEELAEDRGCRACNAGRSDRLLPSSSSSLGGGAFWER